MIITLLRLRVRMLTECRYVVKTSLYSGIEKKTTEVLTSKLSFIINHESKLAKNILHIK